MSREEVIKRFCQLATKVGTEKFNNESATDCFCGSNRNFEVLGGFRFDADVIVFIEQAVTEKMERDKCQTK